VTVALAVSVLTALGVGALLKAGFDHLLGRRKRKLDLAEKSVQIAELLLTRMEGELLRAQTRMEGELARAQEALAKAQQQNKELRPAGA
jgi:hypothetical protein